jgi:hypothetical protein
MLLVDNKMRIFSFPRMACNQLTDTLKQKLHDLQISNLTPEDTYKLYRLTALDYYVSIDTMPPDNFKDIILWAMATAHPRNEDRDIFVSSRIGENTNNTAVEDSDSESYDD